MSAVPEFRKITHPNRVSMNRLPLHERDALQMTLEDAVEMANEGEPSEGYELLRGARYRAEELAADDDAPEWAEALMNLYDQALERYVSRWETGGARRT